jgi:hypothetical protein
MTNDPDNTKKHIAIIRLLVGAADADMSDSQIDEVYIPQIAEARAELAIMKGIDVLNAVLICQRNGLSLSKDVRKFTRTMPERKPTWRRI